MRLTLDLTAREGNYLPTLAISLTNSSTLEAIWAIFDVYAIEHTFMKQDLEITCIGP